MFEVAIGLGVLVSLFFLETFGAAAGGIVVAGYLAMYLHQPITILATLSISFLVYLIVKVLGNFMFIYGRRRMVITVLLGFILGWTARYYGVFSSLSADYSVNVIGFIIPGLIANAMEKQGIIKTLSVMTVAAVVVRLLLVIIFSGKLIG
ncbi:MAG: poly-gamma-glutamate biosynthesis protein PgsC [Candidatus Cloacimonas sp. 4484_143]|nr:MAG: poly-gamma-glutamate biosynthesis protein PgsC [Candidatus Cloacimonas sp. 4484_143]RLC46975.1 MAG: poly-gamma-glutamate biosynthesis protein PgsC [Candidatus Cloacimonadota bacterium]RLC58676.1 MAG: poly-gamma-glutamate biosynthesis protein PgsC [Candidatus Cloacimonadota bacterium]